MIGFVLKFWRSVTPPRIFVLEHLPQALAYAEQEFKLSELQPDGNTLRDALLSVQRQIGRVPKELEELVELPDCMKEYWSWFLKLSNRRPQGMGVSAISYSEMLAFFELIGVVPEPYEIEVIEAFDRVAMKHHQDKEDRDRAKNKAK